MNLVIDASVALKWVLAEPDSAKAEALLRLGDTLLLPDFWLAEATNVLWLRVRRGLLTEEEARKGLGFFRSLAQPVATLDLGLHESALELGFAVSHSPYDSLYVAFAIAIGADCVIAADAPFVRTMRSHPEPMLSRMVIDLDEWAQSRGL